jgi:hypothetical protein
MSYTEWVHVYFGILVALVGGLALLAVIRPAGPARFAWPVVLILTGLVLFIPVEAQSRTYEVADWWDALRSVLPSSGRAYLGEWFGHLNHLHAIQHKAAAVFMMVAGVVEYRRARGQPASFGWGWLFPLLILGVALSFGLHGGSMGHGIQPSERWEHRLMGVVLAAAAVALALVRMGRLQGKGFEGLWAALVLALGLHLTLFYRLDPTTPQVEVHHHESTGPGMR